MSASNQRGDRRFVAKIKNVCLAIPFDGDRTFGDFEEELKLRISRHRKLQNISNLSDKITFIKIKTPHYTDLIDCDRSDKLCDLVTIQDQIVFHTESDDERAELDQKSSASLQHLDHIIARNSRTSVVQDVISPLPTIPSQVSTLSPSSPKKKTLLANGSTSNTSSATNTPVAQSVLSSRSPPITISHAYPQPNGSGSHGSHGSHPARMDLTNIPNGGVTSPSRLKSQDASASIASSNTPLTNPPSLSCSPTERPETESSNNNNNVQQSGQTSQTSHASQTSQTTKNVLKNGGSPSKKRLDPAKRQMMRSKSALQLSDGLDLKQAISSQIQNVSVQDESDSSVDISVSTSNMDPEDLGRDGSVGSNQSEEIDIMQRRARSDDLDLARIARQAVMEEEAREVLPMFSDSKSVSNEVGGSPRRRKKGSNDASPTPSRSDMGSPGLAHVQQDGTQPNGALVPKRKHSGGTNHVRILSPKRASMGALNMGGKGSKKSSQAKDSTSNSMYRVRGGAVAPGGQVKKDVEDNDELGHGKGRSRSKSSHQRSISLTNSGQMVKNVSAKLKRRDSKHNVNKQKGKHRRKASVYEMNAKDRNASRSKRRANAFSAIESVEEEGTSSKGKKEIDDTTNRKTQYQYGNQKINIINPSLLPVKEELVQMPERYLDVTYVHGYSGYDSNFGRQNLLITHDGGELIYPASKVGVVFNFGENTQKIFNECSDIITSLTVHPKYPIVACGLRQHGPDLAKIMTFNYKSCLMHKCIKKAHDAAVVSIQFSKVSNYCYSMGRDEQHMLKIWDNSSLYKINTSKDGRYLGDHDDVINNDGSKLYIAPSHVEEIVISKSEILGMELNPFVSDHDIKNNGVIDEFVTFGKKFAKYWEVKIRKKNTKGRTKDTVLPVGKSLVMNAGRSSKKNEAFEKAYHCCQWLPQPYNGWYILGGHSGNVYMCFKHQFVKKFSTLHDSDNLIACMRLVFNYDQNSGAPNMNSNNNKNNSGAFSIYSAGWDGRLSQFTVNMVRKSQAPPVTEEEHVLDPSLYTPKVKKTASKIVRIPRSSNKKGAETQASSPDNTNDFRHLARIQPRAMTYSFKEDCLFIGLRTNQILRVDSNLDNLLQNATEIDGKDEDGKFAGDDDVPGVKLVIDSHISNVNCVAAHPFEKYFVTGSSDHTLRIWSASSFECIQTFKFDDKESPMCVAFNHQGNILAVGLMSSQFVLLEWDNDPNDAMLSLNVLTIVAMPFKVNKSLKKSQQKAQNSEFSTEVTCIKWNKTDTMIAVGHVDAMAHIFSFIRASDGSVEVAPWEVSLAVSSGIRDMQWSDDNKWLLTFDMGQDTMIWHVTEEEQVFEQYLYLLDPNKVQFIDDPLLAGWDTEGLFQSNAGWDSNDLNALTLTKHYYSKKSPLLDEDCNKAIGQTPQRECKFIVSGSNKGYIRMHNYPAKVELAHYYYGGHSQQVTGVAWTANDEYLVSIGGVDRSVFQWRLVRNKTRYIKNYKPFKNK